MSDSWLDTVWNTVWVYPKQYGSCKDYPRKSDFEVVQAGDSGEALVSKCSIQAGEVAFRFTGPVLPYQTLFTLQLRQGQYIEDPLVMGKVLHSCDPNCVVDMETLTFTAVRDIQPGDAITMDYETTEDVLFRQFQCGCGALKCKGLIKGAKA